MKKLLLRIFLISIVIFFSTCAKDRIALEPELIILSEAVIENQSDFEVKTTSVRLPIIAYHHITDKQKNDMTVSPELFTEHMQFLLDNGYHPITLDRWCTAALHGAKLPSKPIAITFDDAWKNQYEFAIPILEKFGFKATFFAYTDVIGNKTTMTWEQISELSEKGNCIGCHSATHCKMTKQFYFESKEQYKERINREIAGAKKLMEEQLGIPIRHFCYPYGFYNTEIFSMLEEAGFVSAVTVNPAANTFFTPLFKLDRFIIAPWTTVEKLKEKLEILPLNIVSRTPMNGEICYENLKEIKVKFSEKQHLNSVKMKWKWKWTESSWDKTNQTVIHSIKTPLKNKIYTVQLHGWDATSNHYSSAWLFQKKSITNSNN